MSSFFFFPLKVNQVSATLGKDFTMTPSKLVQFDPGTLCVYTWFHVFVRQSRDCGKDRLLCNFSQLELLREQYYLASREISLALSFVPHILFYY